MANDRPSATSDPHGEEPPYTYECMECGERVEAESRPGGCPECGGEMQNISHPRDQ